MTAVKKDAATKPREIVEKEVPETALAREPFAKRIGRRIWQSRTLWCLVGAGAVLLAHWLWTWPQSGWIALTRASWNDERLFVEPKVLSLDGMRAKEKLTLPFHVTNLTEKKLTLRWSNSSNSYIAKVQLPVDIEPGERKEIELSGMVPHTGNYSQYVLFYTSDEIRPAFFVRLSGKLAP